MLAFQHRRFISGLAAISSLNRRLFFLTYTLSSFTILLQMLKGRYKQKEVEDDIAQKQSSWQVCVLTINYCLYIIQVALQS
jgi:hypothetical protein